ncbi:MAG: hypothetical protein A4E44_00597 [Methanosaeta sp. PtaB.Bin018]|jgi:hypothetical protein|nr:MAG: hypothetical protein A4E44_00597 [Methanosaeta sp. PtaB.Bin018]
MRASKVIHTARLNRDLPIPGTMLSLLKIQILEHMNTVLKIPFDKLPRSAIAEVLSSTR